MTLADRAQLRRDVMQAEGCELKPYRDTVGKLTIGYGRNLDDVGISKLEAEVLLDHDLLSSEMECSQKLAWFNTLNEARQRVVVEMVFNLGLPRFLGFAKTINAIRARDYVAAASQMLDSKWATQVGQRAHRLANTMRRGQ
jgi:lysozyme